MVFQSFRRIFHNSKNALVLAMSALLVLMALVLLNSTFQVDVDGGDDEEDLVEKFRDLFSEFLEKPGEDRPSKHIRDTSKGKQKKQTGYSDDQSKSDPSFAENEVDRPKLSPLYSCNYLEVAARLCINIRQLGTTLTIGVRVEGEDRGTHPIHWYRVFKVRGQTEPKSLSFVKFSRQNVPWNINIGGENNELRISPITETDFSYNFFLATLNEGKPEDVRGSKKGHLQLMMFRIEPISIDMGTLYHGEEITINVRSHMELAAQSVQYEWSRIGPEYEPKQNLPSNMKLSRDGSALIIKEHQNYGDMILTCAVYSNKNFTLGRRNFFLKKIALVQNPNLKIGNEVKRKRRYLDEFYAQPRWNDDHSFKSKRSSSPTKDYDPKADDESLLGIETDMPYTEIPHSHSEISSSPQTAFDLADKPEETVLNFYQKTPFANGFVTEKEMVENEEEHEKHKSLNGLIEEANSMVKSGNERRKPEYSTITIVEERPTFEDKESMLMAYCNEDVDCGINAVCFQIDRTERFCKCLPHYRGNGMFCWLF